MTTVSDNAPDLAIYRGNNRPITWRFLQSAVGSGEIYDLTGSSFWLRVTRGRSRVALIDKNTLDDDDLVIDIAAGTLTWNISTDDSRLIPLGKLARIEIERRIAGTEETWLTGYVVGAAGNNPDA